MYFGKEGGMIRGMLAALAVLGLGAGVVAQETANTDSRLTIRGGSTLRSWSCVTQGVSASVHTEPGAGLEIAGLPAGSHRLTVTMPVAAIDCRNGTMNEHLRKALRAERQPEIRFEVEHYAVVDGGVTAAGRLTVAGRTTPIAVHAAVAPAAAGVRAAGSVELRMTQLGVEPPTLMLGTLRVHDTITIDFDVFIARDDLVALR
jgi:hypothetical protein